MLEKIAKCQDWIPSLLNTADNDVKIDVCVLNPPEETSVKKISRKDLDQIDLYTNLSIEKYGNPVLTVGCSLNGSWIPLIYQQPYKWWDRLSKKPKRFYNTPEEPIIKPIKRTDYEYLKKISTSLPKRYSFKPNETKHQTVYKNNGDQDWWDRLSTLPARKIMYRQCIYQKYETLLNNLKYELSKKVKKQYHLKKDNNKNEAKIEEEVESMTDILELLRLDLDEVKGSLSLSFDGLSVIQEECEDELFTSQRDSRQSIKKEEVEEEVVEIKEEEDKIDEQENTSLDNEDLERTLENSIIAVEEFEESNDEASGNKIVDDEKRQSIQIEDTLERSMLEQEQNDVDTSSHTQKSTSCNESEIDTNEILADLECNEYIRTEDILDVEVINEDDVEEKQEEEETAQKLAELEAEQLRQEEEKEERLREEVEKQKLAELETEQLRQEQEKEEFERLKEEEEKQRLAELEAEQLKKEQEEFERLKEEEEKQRLPELEAQEKLAAKQRDENERKTKQVRVVRPEREPWWNRLSKPRRNIPKHITDIPSIKVIKRNKNTHWLRKSNENWVDRLSKPRRPMIKREVFKPDRSVISKKTKRIWEYRRQKNVDCNEWWDRLSKPRQPKKTQ